MKRLMANDGLKLKKTQFSPLGMTLLNRPKKSLSDLEEFTKGQFEIQDEASQLVALQVDCSV